jgi:general L-amino acid transport system permease protein
MNKINFLKPDNQNLSIYLYSGSFLFFIAILDVFLSSFFGMNITSFLPNFVSFLFPLILGIIGLHLIRIEFSGIKNLDLLNKHINTNTFNAVLTLLIIFTVIKSIPPIMSWFIIDANIAGDTKEACTGSGACWTYIKIWLNRFIYGMYPNELQWRINISFILLIALAFVGLIPSEKIKKFLTLYYVVITQLLHLY